MLIPAHIWTATFPFPFHPWWAPIGVDPYPQHSIPFSPQATLQLLQNYFLLTTIKFVKTGDPRRLQTFPAHHGPTATPLNSHWQLQANLVQVNLVPEPDTHKGCLCYVHHKHCTETVGSTHAPHPLTYSERLYFNILMVNFIHKLEHSIITCRNQKFINSTILAVRVFCLCHVVDKLQWRLSSKNSRETTWPVFFSNSS